MFSNKLMQCYLLMYIALLAGLYSPNQALESWERCEETSAKRRSLWKRVQDIEKHINDIDSEIRWLLRKREDCHRDLDRIHNELKNLC